MPRPVSRSAPGISSLRYWTPGASSTTVAGYFTPVGQLDEAVLAVDAHAGGALGDELRAETRGLSVGAAAQIGAGDAGGKAEIILDSGAGTGLPAGRFRLDDEGAEAFAGAVDGGSQACGTSADDHDVIEILGGLDAEADAAGKSFEIGIDEDGAVGEEDDGHLFRIELRAPSRSLSASSPAATSIQR